MFYNASNRGRLRALAALAAASATAFAAPAQSAPSPDAASCPRAYPVADLKRHQPVSGLTVSSGTTPDTFTGRVLGVLKDGIAPGLDMVMVRLRSSEIDRVGGIWAGMSGSPVYAADGRLIGAVSYGLAYGPSPVAGVTPAADMKALLRGSASPSSTRVAADAQRVALSARLKQRLVTAGLASPSEANDGLRRLPLPMSVSSMVSSARLRKAAARMKIANVRLYRAGAAPSSPAKPKIFAGSNLAASLSYGDFSAVGIGTTTMVCGTRVVAFGHPFLFTGASSLTMHGADAIYIQEDSLGGPFKVANPTGPVGAIDGDHLAGISGTLGKLPDTTLVRSQVTSDGRSRTGNTHVSVPDFLPDATFLAELGNQDRVFDQSGPGSSRVHLTVKGSTPDGGPFTLVRNNRFASAYDISFESIFEAADDVTAINDNKFTDVKIDRVRISAHMSPDDRAYSVGKVEQKLGTSYTRLTRSSAIRARAGSTVALRATLNSRRNDFGTKVVMIHVKAPTAPAGTSGRLSVGQAGRYSKFGTPGSSSRPKSFDDLLTQLANAPRNDALSGTIDLFSRKNKSSTSSTERQLHYVVNGSRSFRFRITG